MGLKLHLNWFEKQSEEHIGKEYSKDFGDNDSIIEQLGLPLDDTMNNGVFDVENGWIPFIQPHFKTKIEPSKYWYQISFDYREKW